MSVHITTNYLETFEKLKNRWSNTDITIKKTTFEELEHYMEDKLSYEDITFEDRSRLDIEEIGENIERE